MARNTYKKTIMDASDYRMHHINDHVANISSYRRSPLPSFVGSSSATIPYEEYILAPSSRIVHPASVYQINGDVSNAESVLSDSTSDASLILGANSSVTYDIGKNIGGRAAVVSGVGSEVDSVAITFSESSLWISSAACDATADAGLDAPLVLTIPNENATIFAEQKMERGGFRYMTVVNNGTGALVLDEVFVFFTAMPHWDPDSLRDYTGYFHSSDEQLNRIWYAGAYTNQLVTIDPRFGDSLNFLGIIGGDTAVNGTIPWWSNHTITNGTSALVDGSKRDRLVWAGDMAIAVPGIAVSTYDMISVRNSLDSLFALQSSNGLLPYAGTPFNERNITSFTYHLYTLQGVSDYYQWTGDVSYLQEYWSAWKTGMEWALSQVDETGLADIIYSADWLRFGMGGHNIEANSILAYTLGQGIELAGVLNDSSITDLYNSTINGIIEAANEFLWDEILGLYIDNETTTLTPQDGNVWAVKAGVANLTQAALISEALEARWTPYGAPAPEAADAISPFISGFELAAHFAAERAQAGIDLMRMMWGDFMLDDPRMTNSTFIEGYSTNGELHYAPYSNDPRISHTHGWGTGPTSILTEKVAGLQTIREAGKSWVVAPELGDLTSAEAGFTTPVGAFSVSWTWSGGVFKMDIETPKGTSGRIAIPRDSGGLVEVTSTDGTMESFQKEAGEKYWTEDVAGGKYTVIVQ